jgi:hypothetical protein
MSPGGFTMPKDPRAAVAEVATRDLKKLIAFTSLVAGALLVTGVKLVGELGLPEWGAWAARVGVALAAAVLWHSAAWLLVAEVRRRNARPADPKPDEPKPAEREKK